MTIYMYIYTDVARSHAFSIAAAFYTPLAVVSRAR
jgi:hypothetical protein